MASISIQYSLGKIISDGKFNLLYININSLRNKLDDLEVFIDRLKNDGIIVHFIALTEVRLDDSITKFYGLPDYTPFFCNKQNNSGGVVLYCIDTLPCSLVTKISIDNVELLCVSIINLNIKICVVYKQPKVPPNIFIPILDTFMEKYNRCIIVGDFNFNLLKSADPDIIKLTSTIYSNNYNILNKLDQRMSTRIAIKNGIVTKSIIDHIYSDLPQFDYKFSLLDTALSDHRSIFLSVDNININIDSNNNNSFLHKSINYKKFRSLLIVNPSLIESSFNSIDNIDNCLSHLKEYLSNCTTSKKIFIPNINKPWISPELLTLIEKRNKYASLHKKFPENNFIHATLVRLKTETEKKRRSLRNSHFAKLIAKNINNTKKLWTTFNYVIHNKNIASIKINCIQDATGTIVHEDDAKASILNRHFALSAPTLANILISNNDNKPRNCTLHCSINDSLFMPYFSEEDIIDAISSLKPNKKCDDELNLHLIKTNIDIFGPLITNMANSSFSHGYFPDSLKIARITPLLKSGDCTQAKNYRPISILPSISKILEKLLYNVLLSFVVKHDIINKKQFGFQKKSGTISAVTELVTLLQRALDNPSKKLASAIFIDLAKAFDTISHKAILNKLYKYGIRGKVHSLLQSYLKNRKHFVRIGESASGQENVLFGIPQGSILGPLLFILYINDIFELPLRGTLQLFADDAVVSFASCKECFLFEDMQHDANLLSDWFYNNLLTINIEKTKFILFHAPNKKVDNIDTPIFFNNHPIEKVSSFKYLGLHIEESLKWNTHINELTKKLSPLIGVLRRLNKCTPHYLLRSIYFAHIHSKLMYLCPVWGSSAPAYRINDLQIIQNKAIRNIFYRDYYINNISTDEIYKKHHILKINEMITYETTLFFYKIDNGHAKSSFHLVRSSDIHNHNTRNHSNIRVQKASTNYGLFNVISQGARLFNAIDDYIKHNTTLPQFKKALRLMISSGHLK